MRLLDLARVNRLVADTRSRKAKISILAECLRGSAAVGDPHLIRLAVLYLSGELRQGRVGLGPSLLRQLSETMVSQPKAIAAGTDLDLVAVDEVFEAIKRVSGSGAKTRKLDLAEDLLRRAKDEEQQFLFKLMLGDLSQGALEGVLLEAIAEAAEVPAEPVREAAMLGGALANVAVSALVGGIEELRRYQLEVGRPVQPMLAQSEDSIDAALLKAMRESGMAPYIEWKLDGARVQVHRERDSVRVFSRDLNELTSAMPEVVERVMALPVENIVLDGEVIALYEDGRPRPFQETMRRFGRKREVAKTREEIPLSVQFFDLLHLDDEPLLHQPYTQRRHQLERLLPPDMQVRVLRSEDRERAVAFFEGALQEGHEGVVIKAADAPYQAGRRGAPWIKVKRAKTLDLVVLAAEWGSGRREGWLSNLHLGARDSASGALVMLGKTFKGMTDAVLKWQTDALLQRERERKGNTVWVRPELVVEIALDGVQRSKQYPGGVAIRFARLVRYREDKSASEIDTLDTVRSFLQAD